MKSEKKDPKQKEPWREFRAEDGMEMFIITRTKRSSTFTLMAVRVKDFHRNLRYKHPITNNSATFNLDDDYWEEEHNGERYYVKAVPE